MCFHRMSVNTEDWAYLLDQESILELSLRAGRPLAPEVKAQEVKTSHKEDEKEARDSFLD